MKFAYLFFISIFLHNCGQPKTVLICGDHVCINKTEAKQFFEENLILEVKIVNKKIKQDKEQVDLIELNLNENKKENRQVIISKKESTSKQIQTLSKKDINIIKKKIKNNNVKKKKYKEIQKKRKNLISKNNVPKSKNDIIKINRNVDKKRKEVVDICTILEKCTIDEITKYLLKQGKKESFPDITVRE